MDMLSVDLVIVGGGIVGLSTALSIATQWPQVKLLVLEKEPHVALHQTARNSGVIHSGIYYRPGSMKAQLCVTGARKLVEFCREHSIPCRMTGKLIVAIEVSEVPALEALFRRGLANGVAGLSLMDPEQFRAIEPHARGVRALHVPGAGIVDYAAVAGRFTELIIRTGGAIQTSARVLRCMRREGAWLLETTRGAVRAKFLITCGGLYADRLAMMAGSNSDVRIVPFRGEYYELLPARQYLVNSMIYPVPDPTMPFLGVHLTRSIGGGVHAGPNAVLALKREGYRKHDINLRDTLSLLGFSGFWRMAGKHWKAGLVEFSRSCSKRAFVRALQRLVPEIQPGDLMPTTSGVRAQAVDAFGSLLDDFDVLQSDDAIHVRNAPSPAATASLSIGNVIAERAARAFAFGRKPLDSCLEK